MTRHTPFVALVLVAANAAAADLKPAPLTPVAPLRPAAAKAPAPAKAACVMPPLGRDTPFAIGEKLQFEIDSLGATVGGFTMTVLPGRGAEPYMIEARAKTGTFAANFYPVDAVAEARLGKALEPRSYYEDGRENNVHRTTEVAFPTKEGRLAVRATKEGNREDYSVGAPEETRDMLSALYGVRAMNLADGTEVCLTVFGARRVWTLRAKVKGREPVRTPAGDFQTIHLEGVAVRNDNPKITRELHFWMSDDASKTPVAAFGLVQNKPVRAQLVQYDPGRRKVAQGPRR